MDDNVRLAVRDTPYYVEGSRRPIYRVSVKPDKWKPMRDHMQEMDNHQNYNENDHRHSWSIVVPQTASIDVKHITLASSRIRVYPMDGLLFHADEEHLYEFLANEYTDVISKKYQ